MKKVLLVVMVSFAFLPVHAKEKSYEKGVLLQMDSASCGSTEKDGRTFAGEILGTNGEHKSTQQLLCQDYVLQGERVIYKIRPKDNKHPVLLPIGETAEFRIQKDKLILRVPEASDKEREYLVISMTARTDVPDLRSVKNASGH